MFTNRLNLLRISGIKIGIDFTWIFIAILLSWSLAVGYFPFLYPHLGAGTYWLMGITGMISLFVCIILHELGHALTAKHYGIPTEQITLFIFGGLAEIKKDPPTPKIELFVSIAGPIVSFLIALSMYALTSIGEAYKWPIQVVGITAYLAWINVFIASFNLIPAFPLDGGRILRAILWGWKNNVRWATEVVTNLGLAFGLFLIFLGLFFFITVNIIGGFWMIIIGLYIRYAAYSSRTQFYTLDTLRGNKVAKYMTTNPISVPPDISISDFISKYVYESHHHLYPVCENDTLLGYISIQEVKTRPPEEWPITHVKSVMVPRDKLHTVTAQTEAQEALNLMYQPPESGTLLVVEGNRLVGILTAQNILKLISLKLELEG